MVWEQYLVWKPDMVIWEQELVVCEQGMVWEPDMVVWKQYLVVREQDKGGLGTRQFIYTWLSQSDKNNRWLVIQTVANKTLSMCYDK